MLKFLDSSIGRFRIISFLEGLSLILLVFIAMPLKYFLDSPAMVKTLGQLHGTLFLIFIVLALIVAFQQKWSFTKTTWKVLVSCLIPFGMLYIDSRILKPIHDQEGLSKAS